MAQVAARRSPARVFVWAFHLALPLLLLLMFLTQRQTDLRWENHVAHFWLVAGVALVNAGLAFWIGRDARERQDARLFLVSLAFLAAAGFIGLHALATPQVLVSGRNAGFIVASPVGLLLASGFAALSSVDFTPAQAAAVMRRQGLLRNSLVALMILWAFVSVSELPPLNRSVGQTEAYGPLLVLAIFGVSLYVVAAVQYFRIHRRRPAVVLIGLVTAFALLAEALFNVVFARNWQLSWWEWHVLAMLAFGYIVYSAYVHYQREGKPAGLFQGAALEATLEELRHGYGDALDRFAAAIRRDGRGGRADGMETVEREVARLAQEFELSEGQRDVLRRAAEALVVEQERGTKLTALVDVGRETRLRLPEEELLAHAVDRIQQAFGNDRLRVGLIDGDRTRYSDELGWDELAGEEARAVALARNTLGPGRIGLNGGSLLVLPLVAKDDAIGVLEVHRPDGAFDENDEKLLETVASQLAVAIENARLYRRLDELLRTYLTPEVATELIDDRQKAELGGQTKETTILFADLAGYTSFSEHRAPDQVLALLNRYFGKVVPVVRAEGGILDKFVGDAFMARFPVDRPDHALGAVRAALAVQEAIEAEAGADDPRFRIGVYTGTALIGNLGSVEYRNLTAIGDAVNYAARLQQKAEPGEVVIGSSTYQLIRHAVRAVRLDVLGVQAEVKGKSEVFDAYLVLGLRDEPVPIPTPTT